MTPDAEATPSPAPPKPSPADLTRGSLIAACSLLPLLWLWRVVFAGHVLLPIPLLRQIAPWGEPVPGGPWNPLMWDAVAFFYPIRLAAAQAIRNGVLPLWNPWILCGTPLLADVQSAVLYPLNVLFWVMPVERAFGASAYLHLILAGLFTMYWLRREGASRSGSLLGAVTFAFGGWSIAWLELPNFMATAVWLPLLLGLLAGADRRSVARTWAGCALSTGIMLTAGHLQIAFYCLLAALLYAIYGDAAERRTRRLPPFVLGGVLGLMLAAPQLLPAADLSSVSHRSTVATGAGYAAFTGQGLPLAHLAGFAAPDFFGNPSHGTWLGLGEYSELTAYLGILPLLLALHALFDTRRNRAVGALALLAGAGLLLALGTPLNAPFYFGVPGFARFGSPGRALILLALAGSGLAAFGWDRLRRSFSELTTETQRHGETLETSSSLSLEWKRTLLLGVAVLTLLIVLGALLYPAEGRAAVLLVTGAPAILRAAVLFALAGAVPLLASRASRWLFPAALLLTVADLWTFGAGYNLTGPASALQPPERFAAAVKEVAGEGRILAVNPSWPLREPPRAVLPPNLSIPLGLLDVGGYEGAYLLSYKAQLNEWEGKDASPPTNGNLVMPTNLLSPLLRELAVRAVLSPRPLPPELVDRAGLRYVDGEQSWHLYAVRNPTARAEFFTQWPPPQGVKGTPLPILSQPNPNKVVIRTPDGRKGYVLLRDAGPGYWEPKVDGADKAPLRTDSSVSRGVEVEEGSREVVWRFFPLLEFGNGLILAGIGGVGTLLLALFGRRNYGRSRRQG